MTNLAGFNANEVEPLDEFEAIPAGKYEAVIVASEMKDTKAGDGAYLELEIEVIDGPHKGRKLWDRLNLENKNGTAVKIARSTLSSICRAVGVLEPRDSCELHDLPLCVTVKCRKREDTGDVTNEVRGYAKKESLNGKPVQAATDTPPWRR
jgi:hypothetical protein